MVYDSLEPAELVKGIFLGRVLLLNEIMGSIKVPAVNVITLVSLRYVSAFVFKEHLLQ